MNGQPLRTIVGVAIIALIVIWFVLPENTDAPNDPNSGTTTSVDSVSGSKQKHLWEQAFSDVQAMRNTTPSQLPELSFAEQLEQVRAGESTAIVTEELVTLKEWRQLFDSPPELLRRLEVTRIDFDATELSQLSKLPSLEVLRLEEVEIGPAIGVLQELKNLRVLNAPIANCEPDQLNFLLRLDKLDLLRIGGPLLSDDWLGKIAKHTSLRFLHVIDTPVTDEGLKLMAQWKTLESLYADNTKITPNGVVALSKQLPDLHIHVDQVHVAGPEPGE